MLELEIVPGVGIGPIRLGATPHEVAAAFPGVPEAIRAYRYETYSLASGAIVGRAGLFAEAIQVGFDVEGRVSSVAASSHPQLRFLLDGIELFEPRAWKSAKLGAERSGLVFWEAELRNFVVSGLPSVFRPVVRVVPHR